MARMAGGNTRAANREAQPVGYTSAAALDLLSHGQAALIHKDAETTTFIEEEYRDIVPLFTYPPAVASGENCWSCGKFFTYAQHSECDGYCPHCDAPVDLDEGEEGTAPPAPAVEEFGARRCCKDKKCNAPIVGYSVDGLCEDCYMEMSKRPAPVVNPEFTGATAVPDPDYVQHLKNVQELYHRQEDRLFALAQRIRGASFDKYSHSTDQAIDVLEREIFGDDGDDCRSAMRAQPVSQGYKLPDGWKLVPIEATPEILQAGITAHYERQQYQQPEDAKFVGPMESAYNAMLAAAPEGGNG